MRMKDLAKILYNFNQADMPETLVLSGFAGGGVPTSKLRKTDFYDTS